MPSPPPTSLVPPAAQRSGIGRLQVGVSVVALLFLVFVGGAVVGYFKVFPFVLLFREPFEYVDATRQRRELERIAATDEMADIAEPHVSIPARPGASPGYTFFSSNANRPSTALLIDADGKIVHRWQHDLSRFWSPPPHRGQPSPDSAISWRHGRLMPNGDVVVVLKAHGDSPEGYGLAKFDKDSNLIWAVPDNIHHQFTIADDGRIYTMAHAWRDTVERPLPSAPKLPRTVLEDFLVVISPAGKELERFSLLEAMADPQHAHYLTSDFQADNAWDLLHPNDVEPITPAFAAHHPWLRPGMMMLSFRDLDALAVFDPATRKIVRIVRSLWRKQHDPDLLPDGGVLLFDNQGNVDAKVAGRSRMLEVDVSTGGVRWAYAGSAEHKFYTRRAGGQELTPTGTVLISEDSGGRIFEVTRAGEIVWEYKDKGVRHALRVPADWVKFPLNHGTVPPGGK